MWRKFGHATLGYPRQQSPRTPPRGLNRVTSLGSQQTRGGKERPFVWQRLDEAPNRHEIERFRARGASAVQTRGGSDASPPSGHLCLSLALCLSLWRSLSLSLSPSLALSLPLPVSQTERSALSSSKGSMKRQLVFPLQILAFWTRINTKWLQCQLPSQF